MKKIFTLFAALLMMGAANAETVTVDFEGINLAKDSYDNGVSAGGAFSFSGFSFCNNYDTTYGSWDGYSISTMTSTAFSSYVTDQWNSCVGCGADNSLTYAVCYYSSWATVPNYIVNNEGKTFTPQSVAITNAAYAFSSMLNGDSYAKKFTEADWFKLTFKGEKNGQQTGTVDVYLAKGGMVVFTWKTIDLTPLGEVDNITFSLESSDTGSWGMNTPAYFCMDNLVVDVNTTTAVRTTATKAAAATVTALYDANGRKLSAYQRGLNIVEMSDGTVRKVMR